MKKIISLVLVIAAIICASTINPESSITKIESGPGIVGETVEMATFTPTGESPMAPTLISSHFNSNTFITP